MAMKGTVFQIFGKYKKLFWISNTIELFERWAWYGFYMAFALFLVNSEDTGALGFTQAQKGIIMGTGSMLLYFLPLLTGAIADKLGFRRMLFLAFTLYLTGFFMIMNFESFGSVFFSFIWICTGGAFFKPVISAVIAKTTDEETSSIGFGIFYLMVNIGGFIGPFIAGILLGKSWDYVFLMSMAAIGLNILITLFFFRDPVNRGPRVPAGKSVLQAFANIRETLTNGKYLLFLLIMVLFWTSFNQLYYSFPVFVDQWVDTGPVFRGIQAVSPRLAGLIGTNEGTISAVTISSLDSFFIILFQLAISALVMRFKPLSAMTGGILVLSVGVGMMFSFQNGWYILLGLLVFGWGEMASSPKFTEYIGRIAPDDKKALYMGTSYLPVAAGHLLGGWLSGSLFGQISDKYYLLGKELAERGISLPAISGSFTKNDFWQEACRQTGLSSGELTDLLWRHHHPSSVWMLFSGIAFTAFVLLWIYDKLIVGKGKK